MLSLNIVIFVTGLIKSKNMKYDWKKQDKLLYLPKTKPELIQIPAFKFFSLEGKGNPNDNFFSEYISVLYSLSYAVKMSSKSGFAPDGYFEYTVFPLEGVWDIREEAKKRNDGILNKDELIFNLMIRQPDFVTDKFAREVIERTKEKKPHELLNYAKFEIIEECLCVQMMHVGSYDNEPESFHQMEEFAAQNNVERKNRLHREIYLSDARKIAPEKLKTVLRFQVNPVE